jgi:large subunit ribosomal protein L25
MNLSATVRDGHGKGAARRLRRAGLVPAVVYAGGSEATSVAVKPLELARALTGSHKRNALIDLEIEGKGARKVMLKELQKDPLMRTPRHADFVEVDVNKPINVKVPFVATGRSRAVQLGGKLHTPARTLNVRCLPTAIPATIEFDTSELDYGAHRAAAVTMPDGVELLDDLQLTVATISRPRGVQETDGEGEGEAAAEAPAAG